MPQMAQLGGQVVQGLHELVWKWIRCVSNLSLSIFPWDLYSSHKRQIRLLYTVSRQGGAVRTSGQKGNHGHHKSKIWLYPYVCIYDTKIHVGELQQKMCKLTPEAGCSTLYLGEGHVGVTRVSSPTQDLSILTTLAQKKIRKKYDFKYYLLKTQTNIMFLFQMFPEINFILELISTHCIIQTYSM